LGEGGREVAVVDPDAVEIRVLGCLLEKQRTTPDAYPLTLNALRLACNQTTNRDPVVEYDEAQIRGGLTRLAQRRWARAASGAGSRAAKFRHLFDEALGLGDDEVAVLTVLMLRGPQTVGELKGRTERMHRFADLDALHETLEQLQGRELVERLERRPGEKGARWRQLIGGGETGTEDEQAEAEPSLAERVARLESEVAEIRDRLGRA
jgi:uncharacterized protein